MRKLKFIMPNGVDLPFEGYFTTCRYGDKWADLKPEDIVEIWICNKSHYGNCADQKGCFQFGTATVSNVWTGDFLFIPARFLQYEHDPKCRDFPGLYGTMYNIYGPKFYDNPFVAFLMLKTNGDCMETPASVSQAPC